MRRYLISFIVAMSITDLYADDVNLSVDAEVVDVGCTVYCTDFNFGVLNINGTYGCWKVDDGGVISIFDWKDWGDMCSDTNLGGMLSEANPSVCTISCPKDVVQVELSIASEAPFFFDSNENMLDFEIIPINNGHCLIDAEINESLTDADYVVELVDGQKLLHLCGVMGYFGSIPKGNYSKNFSLNVCF